MAGDLPEDFETVRVQEFDDGNQCDKCGAKPAATFRIPVHTFGDNGFYVTACRPHALEPLRAVRVFDEWFSGWRAGNAPSE